MLPKLLKMKQDGASVPALDDQPQPTEFNAFGLDLFFSLNQSRQFDGMSGLPLPLTIADIQSMLELSGVNCAERRAWNLEIIQAADASYLEWWSKKHAKNKG